MKKAVAWDNRRRPRHINDRSFSVSVQFYGAGTPPRRFDARWCVVKPGDIIDGTKQHVASVLQVAPTGTVLSDRDGDVWQNPSGEAIAQFRPLTVLRWGRELPKPAPKPADWPDMAITAMLYETGCRVIAAAGIDVTDTMRGRILSSALRCTAPDAPGGAS